MSTSSYRRYPMIVPHPLTHWAGGRRLPSHLTKGEERDNTVDPVGHPASRGIFVCRKMYGTAITRLFGAVKCWLIARADCAGYKTSGDSKEALPITG